MFSRLEGYGGRTGRGNGIKQFLHIKKMKDERAMLPWLSAGNDPSRDASYRELWAGRRL